MLDFYPLYWIYHDCWRWTETTATDKEPAVQTNFHAGHIHLFMMDYNPNKTGSQQAYTGKQIYSFSIEDEWGPNSTNPSQIRAYKLVGKPRWYFKIKEYWRRVYIQPWDVEDHIKKLPLHPDRIGIRYDASLPQHTLGPFREGRGLYFFQPDVNRTLPVEYWLDEDKKKRDHLLRKTHYEGENGEVYSWDETPGGEIWAFEDSGVEWKRLPKGWNYYYYWDGDNKKEENGEDFYKKGEIYYFGKNELGKKKFFKNTFISSYPVPEYGGKYFPNPTPGGDLDTLREDYLLYYGKNWEYYYGNGYVYSYGRKYVSEYANWKKGKDMYGTGPHSDPPSNPNAPEEELFLEFITLKQEEFMRICQGGIPRELSYNGYEEWDEELQEWVWIEKVETDAIVFSDWESDFNGNMKMEFVFWDDFITIWQELSQDECLKLGLYGSYPARKQLERPSNMDYDETYHHPVTKEEVSPFDAYKSVFSHRDVFTIPRNSVCSGDATQGKDTKFPVLTGASYTDEDGARRVYSDNLFLGPVIEYQEVWQLGKDTSHGERLPAAATADAGIDVWTDPSGAFGEGFSVSISIPFEVNGVVQSPFSDDEKKVYPPGNYFHNNISEDDQLKYAFETYGEKKTLEELKEALDAMQEWERKKAEAEENGTSFSEKKPSLPFDKIEKYRRSEYLAFFSESHTTEEQLEWYNTNYAERPIIQNPKEGMFDERSVWIPEVTQDRPTIDQVAIGEGDLPILTHPDGKSARKTVKWETKEYEQDGTWVEQCLGAKIEAQVELIFEDALGHRWSEWVTATQAESSDGFVGKD